jgi:ribosomal protein S17E
MPIDICRVIAESADKFTMTPVENEEVVKELMKERSKYTNNDMPRMKYVSLW